MMIATLRPILADMLEVYQYATHTLPFEAAQPSQIAMLAPPLIVLELMQVERQTGWAVLSALKGTPETNAIPVVMYSVINEEERAKRAGAVGFIAKPIDESHLLSEVQRHILNSIQEGGADVSSAATQ